MSYLFELPPSYDFELTCDLVRYYNAHAACIDGVLWLQGRLHESPFVARVTSVAKGGDVQQIQVEIVGRPVSANDLQMRALLRHMLSIDVTTAPLETRTAWDAVMLRTSEKLSGLRLIQTSTVFEALMVTMIEQQISLQTAQKAERWLVRSYGDVIHHQGRDHYVFPSPERLAGLTLTELAPLKITFLRIARIIAIAQSIYLGTLPLEALRGQHEDAALTALMALNGVGRWTAAWTMIRALGQFPYVGSADVALRAAVNHYWLNEKGRASRESTDALFAQFGESAGWAAVMTLLRWGTERYPNMGRTALS